VVRRRYKDVAVFPTNVHSLADRTRAVPKARHDRKVEVHAAAAGQDLRSRREATVLFLKLGQRDMAALAGIYV
jgi:hypothetical protein